MVAILHLKTCSASLVDDIQIYVEYALYTYTHIYITCAWLLKGYCADKMEPKRSVDLVRVQRFVNLNFSVLLYPLAAMSCKGIKNVSTVMVYAMDSDDV